MINCVSKPFLCIPVNDIEIISIGKVKCFMLNFVYKNDRFAIFKSLEIMSHHNVGCFWPDRCTHFHNKGRFFARFPERRVLSINNDKVFSITSTLQIPLVLL